MKTLRIAAGHKKKKHAQALKQKALEPQVKHCWILDIEVTVLVEYPDYKGPRHKGPEGAIYCEHILPCYQADRRCRYSGISPLFPDPFVPRERPAEAAGDEPTRDEGEDSSLDFDPVEPVDAIAGA